MSGGRLLLDEMLSARIAVQLRARGIDVEAVQERRDLVGCSDETLFELATSEQRTLVTKNIVDFEPLSRQWSAQGRTHTGLLFISTKTFPEDRSFMGAVTAALARAAEQHRLPPPGQVIWLGHSAVPGAW